MPTNDPMISTGVTQPLPPMTTVYPDVSSTQPPKEPNKFLKVLGGIAGSAVGLVSPGLGGILGNVIGGSGGSYGTLIQQQQQFEQMQRYNQMSTMQQQQQQNQMMNQQQQSSMNLIGVQQRVSMQAQEFTSVSNLLKSRHDSEMSAVNNFKS